MTKLGLITIIIGQITQFIKQFQEDFLLEKEKESISKMK